MYDANKRKQGGVGGSNSTASANLSGLDESYSNPSMAKPLGITQSLDKTLGGSSMFRATPPPSIDKPPTQLTNVGDQSNAKPIYHTQSTSIGDYITNKLDGQPLAGGKRPSIDFPNPLQQAGNTVGSILQSANQGVKRGIEDYNIGAKAIGASIGSALSDATHNNLGILHSIGSDTANHKPLAPSEIARAESIKDAAIKKAALGSPISSDNSPSNTNPISKPSTTSEEDSATRDRSMGVLGYGSRVNDGAITANRSPMLDNNSSKGFVGTFQVPQRDSAEGLQPPIQGNYIDQNLVEHNNHVNDNAGRTVIEDQLDREMRLRPGDKGYSGNRIEGLQRLLMAWDKNQTDKYSTDSQANTQRLGNQLDYQNNVMRNQATITDSNNNVLKAKLGAQQDEAKTQLEYDKLNSENNRAALGNLNNPTRAIPLDPSQHLATLKQFTKKKDFTLEDITSAHQGKLPEDPKEVLRTVLKAGGTAINADDLLQQLKNQNR